MNSPYTSSATKPLYRATQVVWYLLYIIEALLAMRFLLRLLGANSAAEFTRFIYGISYPLVAPFMNVFRVNVVEGATFEWPTLLAMIFYYLLAYIIIKLILVGRPVSINEATEKLEEQDK